MTNDLPVDPGRYSPNTGCGIRQQLLPVALRHRARYPVSHPNRHHHTGQEGLHHPGKITRRLFCSRQLLHLSTHQ
ncbi:MAG: hypothetical protein ACUVTU_00170 [Desulfurispora sp.]|uniref:hypothetical protein n=1 Tax=Desulfurispora sp. TaxID=3014275 RepID=UPI00404B6939